MAMQGIFYKKLMIVVLIFLSSNAQANKLFCNTENIDMFINAKSIEFINISTHKSKKWSKNYFKALKSPDKSIQKKYKKKFKADVEVRFNNGLSCKFYGKIRISGDWKDHLTDTPPITSLDVSLLTGNINSTVKFKLFIPHTRNADNEVFSTALLRELGFLAPKTYHVPATFNGKQTTFLFQEKITKEFIESNNLREAPILEGDERFLFTDNGRTDFDPVLAKFALARVDNGKWAKKGVISLEISKIALARLNKAFFGNFISNLSSKEYENKNREFNSILAAIGASHGLSKHNRKFYYNPFYRRLEPIYYDGDSTITNLTSLTILMIRRDKISNDEIIGAPFALKSLYSLNREKFHVRLKELGLKYSFKRMNVILNLVIKNLKKIKSYSVSSYQKKKYIPYFSNSAGLTTVSENNKKLVFSTDRESYVEICDLLIESCYYKILPIKDYSDLLQGEYSDGSGDFFIFIGDRYEYLFGKDSISYRKKEVINVKGDTKLIVYGSPDVKINKKLKKIELIQKNADDRFLLKGGSLSGWNIEFIGVSEGVVINKQRFNRNLLTGCLTLLDINIDGIDINANGGLCEDIVNLVRVNGSIRNIDVTNALSDAIDVDFSNLNFASIQVKNAGNDCVDLSSGNYYIKDSELVSCKDKAISVGEGSTLSINSSKISMSNIGVASKDSSTVKVKSIDIISTPVCFSAYNKKQEFWGGKMIVSRHNCRLKQFVQQKGSLIESVQ